MRYLVVVTGHIKRELFEKDLGNGTNTEVQPRESKIGI